MPSELKLNTWYPNKLFKRVKLLRYIHSSVLAISGFFIFLTDVLDYLHGDTNVDLWSGFFWFLLGVFLSSIHFILSRRVIPPRAIMFTDKGIMVMDLRRRIYEYPLENIESYDIEMLGNAMYIYIYFKKRIHGRSHFSPNEIDKELTELLFTYLKSKGIPRRGVDLIEVQ